jgi:ferredoxin
MKVRVDSEKCQGHNRCYALAPGLFQVDDYGYATARGDGTVPAGMEEKARLAVENCPERAIEMTEEGGPAADAAG